MFLNLKVKGNKNQVYEMPEKNYIFINSENIKKVDEIIELVEEIEAKKDFMGLS